MVTSLWHSQLGQSGIHLCDFSVTKVVALKLTCITPSSQPKNTKNIKLYDHMTKLCCRAPRKKHAVLTFNWLSKGQALCHEKTLELEHRVVEHRHVIWILFTNICKLAMGLGLQGTSYINHSQFKLNLLKLFGVLITSYRTPVSTNGKRKSNCFFFLGVTPLGPLQYICKTWTDYF